MLASGNIFTNLEELRFIGRKIEVSQDLGCTNSLAYIPYFVPVPSMLNETKKTRGFIVEQWNKGHNREIMVNMSSGCKVTEQSHF